VASVICLLAATVAALQPTDPVQIQYRFRFVPCTIWKAPLRANLRHNPNISGKQENINMALTYLEQTSPAKQAMFDRLATMAIALAVEMRRRSKIRKSLAGLSPRSLRDAGLIAAEVEAACREPLSRNVCDELHVKAWLRSKN
jgi:hypothetical protein